MKKTLCLFCILLFVSTMYSDIRGQNIFLDIFFAEPRHGGFKILKHDDYDISDANHFVGSGVLALGFYKLFQSRKIKHPKVWAGVLTTSLGLLKEWEDGYREGWSIKDTILNQFGIVSFLLLSEYTHFTLTIDEVFSRPHYFGVGLRFFRTSEIKPLNSSIGFFAYYITMMKLGWVWTSTYCT